MRLVDSHSHFDAAEFDVDRAAAHARALAAGVARQVVPAVDAAGWPKLKRVCAEFAGLFPAYGLHPMYLESHRPQHLRELRDRIERERPLAVGECGLDFFVEGLDAAAQAFYFEGQLRMAREFDLPLAPAGSTFQRAVWDQLVAIKWGETASYGEIAHRLGHTNAASRAVGLANGRNPIPIVIPCHRVIGANGSLTGYAGGLERKQLLLDLEVDGLF